MQVTIITAAAGICLVVGFYSGKFFGYKRGESKGFDQGKQIGSNNAKAEFAKERVKIEEESFGRGQVTGEAIGYEKGFAAGKVDPRDPATGKYVTRKSKK